MVGNHLVLVYINLKLLAYSKLSVWAITLSHPRFLLFASDSGFLPHFFKMFWSNRGAWHNIRGMGVCRINEKISLTDMRQPFLSNFYDFLHFCRFFHWQNTISCKFADKISKKSKRKPRTIIQSVRGLSTV